MAIIIATFLAEAFFNKMAYFFARFYIYRRIGIIFATDNNPLASPWLKLIMESYFDIALALFLQNYFTFITSDVPLSDFLVTYSEWTNSLLNFIFLAIMLWFPFFLRIKILQALQPTPKGEKIKEKYEIFLEGSSTKSELQGLNQFYFICRRFMSALVLVLLSEFPYIQISIMLLMSFYNITYLVTYKPIADSHENKIEIFNETCILLFSYMVATCLNVAMPQDMNDLIGFLMIGFTASNIIVNLAIVGMMTVRDMYSVLKDLPNQIKTKQKSKQFDQDRDLLIQNNLDQFQRLQGQKDFEEAIEFCFEWKPHRNWLANIGIDFESYPDQIKFQKLAKYHNFNKVKLQAESKIKIQQMLIEYNSKIKAKQKIRLLAQQPRFANTQANEEQTNSSDTTVIVKLKKKLQNIEKRERSTHQLKINMAKKLHNVNQVQFAESIKQRKKDTESKLIGLGIIEEEEEYNETERVNKVLGEQLYLNYTSQLCINVLKNGGRTNQVGSVVQCLLSSKQFVKYLLITAAESDKISQYPVLKELVDVFRQYCNKNEGKKLDITDFAIRDLSKKLRHQKDPHSVYSQIHSQMSDIFNQDLDFLELVNLGLTKTTSCKNTSHNKTDDRLIQILELPEETESLEEGVQKYFKSTEKGKCCKQTTQIFSLPILLVIKCSGETSLQVQTQISLNDYLTENNDPAVYNLTGMVQKDPKKHQNSFETICRRNDAQTKKETWFKLTQSTASMVNIKKKLARSMPYLLMFEIEEME